MDMMGDVSPTARRIQIDVLRRMTEAERLELARELTLGVQQLAFIGLRQMHPDATDDELWLRLAVHRLGAETVRKVYGRVPETE